MTEKQLKDFFEGKNGKDTGLTELFVNKVKCATCHNEKYLFWFCMKAEDMVYECPKCRHENYALFHVAVKCEKCSEKFDTLCGRPMFAECMNCGGYTFIIPSKMKEEMMRYSL